MSGGVDSSAAAYLLKEHGYDVVGATMCFGLSSTDGNPKSCCDPLAVSDAKRVCQKLRMPHYTLDYAELLHTHVIADFIAEYRRGRTPNPCVRCNQRLKFGALLQKADELGMDTLATGHYASIVEDAEGFHLEAAFDTTKDQSYFLWGIRKADLSRILFPVSDIKKTVLREIAEGAGLSTAQKKESQDICFVTDGNYRSMLLEQGVETKPGDMVHIDGRIVGRHRGIEHYTIGQRKGLGVALGEPQFVCAVDVPRNRVVIGPRQALDGNGCMISEYNAFESLEGRTLSVKIRSTMAAVPCVARREGDDNVVRIDFAQPLFAVSCGQSAVLYDGTRVVGGGIIDRCW